MWIVSAAAIGACLIPGGGAIGAARTVIGISAVVVAKIVVGAAITRNDKLPRAIGGVALLMAVLLAMQARAQNDDVLLSAFVGFVAGAVIGIPLVSSAAALWFIAEKQMGLDPNDRRSGKENGE